MQKRIVFILCIVMLCFTSCATTSKKAKNRKAPTWIYAPYEQYSSTKYFAAVGNNKIKNIAELKAVEQLSVVFGIDIQSSNASDTYMKHTESEVLSQTFSTSELNQQILVEIDQKDLIGIEITETYYDSKNDEWYALALLDKEKTSDLYAALVKSNNETIKSYLSYAKTLPDSIEKLAYLYKSFRIAQVTESFFVRFYIINPKRCTELKEISYVASDLKMELEKLAYKIPVGINVQEDSISMVRNACGEMLETFGLVSSSNSEKYLLNVKINKTYREVENPTLYYCEFQISVELQDKKGLVLAPWQLTSRAGAKTEALAEQKAYQLITQKIKEEYRDSFETYLYGEIK